MVDDGDNGNGKRVYGSMLGGKIHCRDKDVMRSKMCRGGGGSGMR